MKSEITLSRRERQIMDIIYQRKQASVWEVLDNLPDPPSYSAVRALMRILEEKGHLKHTKKGARFIYIPTVSRAQASRSAIKRVLRTFFNGSVEQAVSAMLDVSNLKLSPAEMKKLEQLIDKAKQGGRKP